LVEAKNDEFRGRRVLNQELATLFSYAIHTPEEMPDFTETNQSEPEEMPEDMAHALLSAHFLAASRKPERNR